MIKEIIPKVLLAKLIKIVNKQRCVNASRYDANRYYFNSGISGVNSKNKHIGQIIMKYHVIEKGLTMPKMRYGFGKEMMLSLIEDCFSFYREYGVEHMQFVHALRVIAEYKEVHEKNGKKIENKVLQKIDSLLSKFPNVVATKQFVMTKEEFFKSNSSDFYNFSNTRHSLRNFKGAVKIDLIKEAIQLAQNAPTACNRQPVRVYVVENKQKIVDLLNIQNGNRGFGYLADKLIIITAELGGYGGARERNLAYIDAGIYTMNLLYSLHYYKIGACTLNWCEVEKDDVAIRSIIDIPKSEVVVLFIACGGVPDNFHLAYSLRNPLDMVTKIVK